LLGFRSEVSRFYIKVWEKYFLTP